MPTVDGIGRPGQYGPEHNCAFVLVSGSSVTCSYKHWRHWHCDCNYLTTNVFLRRKCLEFPNKLIASQIFDNTLWLFTRHWNVCRRLVSMKIFKENKKCLCINFTSDFWSMINPSKGAFTLICQSTIHGKFRFSLLILLDYLYHFRKDFLK